MSPTRVALALSLLTLGAGAQALTLGELQDRGAQRLTPADARSFTPLQMIRESADSDARMTLHADGTVSGTVLNKQGHGISEATGTWTLDAAGKRCVDVDLPDFRMKWRECGYPWQLDGTLYHVASETDREALATPYLATAILRP